MSVKVRELISWLSVVNVELMDVMMLDLEVGDGGLYMHLERWLESCCGALWVVCLDGHC
jgi:hypothetical protein